MNDPKDLTAPIDRASLVTKYAEVRQQLWLLIGVCKNVATKLPDRERAQMLEVSMKAEEALR